MLEKEALNAGAHGALNMKFKWFKDDWFKEISTNMMIEDDGDKAFNNSFSTFFDTPAFLLTYTLWIRALGTLKMNQYMLIPSNCKIPTCPVNHIGAGVSVYDPGALPCAGVYALAKAQALDFGWDKDKAIKWAVLRMEAFVAGWFDHQELTAFKHAPSTCLTTFVEDRNEIMKHVETAWALCNFLPFLAEFQLWAYGTSYQKTDDRAEYVRRAKMLATTSQLKETLDYLDDDTLFGVVLIWVDVKRPMKALNDSETCCRVFDVFKDRMKRAPAGQALITTCVAIITSLEKANWWSRIKEEGNYKDEKLIRPRLVHRFRGNSQELHLKSCEIPCLVHRLHGI